MMEMMRLPFIVVRKETDSEKEEANLCSPLAFLPSRGA
jgi:hypothetical protein